VASKLPGRIAVLKVREGDACRPAGAGPLEDTQLAAKQQQADAAVATVAAQLEAARAQLAIARREVPLAEASADAVLAKARAAEAQAAKDARRFDELAERGTVETRRAEQMRLPTPPPPPTCARPSRASARPASATTR
jgi:HlyD family secretion protein